MAIDSNTIENVKAKIPYGFDVNAKLEKKDKGGYWFATGNLACKLTSFGSTTYHVAFQWLLMILYLSSRKI